MDYTMNISLERITPGLIVVIIHDENGCLQVLETQASHEKHCWQIHTRETRSETCSISGFIVDGISSIAHDAEVDVARDTLNCVPLVPIGRNRERSAVIIYGESALVSVVT